MDNGRIFLILLIYWKSVISTSDVPSIRECFVGQFRIVSSSQYSADRHAGDIGEAEFPSLEEVG
jgi:hypothetical protein